MKKKALIIGSKGMAGHVVYQYLKTLEDFIIEDVSRSNDWFSSTYTLDVTDTGSLSAAITQSKPDYVINCVGILNQDAESHPDKAILLNTFLPHFLARVSSSIGAKLIHISTDCVFNGKKGNYLETDVKDGTGFYAQSKALGEVVYGNHLTIRTSIIGPELKENGIGLFDWFMRQNGPVKGYTKAFWTGVTTIALAKALPAVMQQEPRGLIHLVNGEKINKYDLISLFRDIFDRPVDIKPDNGYEVDKSLLNTSKQFDYQVPGYAEMIRDMKEWINGHESLYKRYISL